MEDYKRDINTAWDNFCESYMVLAKAVREVVEENKKLKEKVKCYECVHRGKTTCPLFYGEAGGMRFFTPYAKKNDFSCDNAERRTD